jgi:galactokinase
MSTFESLRSGGARIYRAPCRVNLIGEHTDYNDRFVMPAAIDLYTRVAIRPRDDRTLRIHSENYSESWEFDLDEPAPIARGHWSDYVCGVAVILEGAGHNTMVKRELAASEYNTRRVECEAAVRYFAERLPVVRALRDVTLDDLARLDGELSDALMRRCRHVISENARVAEAANAFEVGDLEVLGRLMAESHRSLRDDYPVSCEELDVMIELAGQVEGVYGSRMTGGGFGGCTINLVNADRDAQFEESITRGYQQATGISPQIIVCSAAGGARRISTAQTKRLTLEE